MTKPILPIGSFVWCRFPFRENHRMPGPNDHPHLVYVAESSQNNQVLTVYTTSVAWNPGTPVAFGVIVVPPDLAATMQQKPFCLDTRRVAVLPVTEDWFPSLGTESRGIISRANKAFRTEVNRVFTEVISRHREIVELYGPEAADLSEKSR
ncbi:MULTISPECIES: hypothetical protein [unclassified Undibacterium]|uniref:hypothetical protein n=1 Tax=unclassified Undibacterium TaxID=2630295 RepID=UPI002AC8F7A7|nr:MULTISPECIES: hypothetical protein [unclassified Undibacterium]MEB0139067.1 hypothetical protein [Undibacterium sp. CCC2.1]MEB0172976.1 hypothetical protein [Undibacterium sp. CCC1.1]MEB0177298.1 hypothetical protein [Undibacterium sp. CCC3.4]MEB0215894.1 hypothetical protein [Undibacterium sp. 5I2]WPX42095.1 hypothetical protein RHM61_11820 [Undibacterium sp. CCC3.4]